MRKLISQMVVCLLRGFSFERLCLEVYVWQGDCYNPDARGPFG
jgi:hypothetical protein